MERDRRCRTKWLRRFAQGRFCQAERFPQICLDGVAELGTFDQSLAGVFSALSDPLAFVAVPGTALFDDLVFGAEVKQVAFFRNPDSIEDIDFSFPKRRGDLVLDDLDLGAITNHRFAVLNGGRATNLGANAGEKFQRAASGGGFRVTEHDPDLFANLIDEDEARVGAGN